MTTARSEGDGEDEERGRGAMASATGRPERLAVYQAALRFLVFASDIVRNLPRGCGGGGEMNRD